MGGSLSRLVALAVRSQPPHRASATLAGAPPASLARAGLLFQRRTTMAQSTSRGRFVWHELVTNDPKAAIDFYARLIGWKAQVWDRNPAYTLLLAESGPIGGVMEPPAEAKSAGAPPNWLSYIDTPDVTATVRRVLLARARDDRPGRRARLLSAALRVGKDRGDGHGADGGLSDVRVGRQEHGRDL